MGVRTKEDCSGDHPVEVYCSQCDDTFWIDETMTNECPTCGHLSTIPAN